MCFDTVCSRDLKVCSAYVGLSVCTGQYDLSVVPDQQTSEFR